MSNIYSSDDNVGEPQLVWCLGKVGMRSTQRDSLDVGLFSLLNLLTVDGNMASSRPTFLKLEHMLRNKVQNIESLTNALVKLYQELMGDIDELVLFKLITVMKIFLT